MCGINGIFDFSSAKKFSLAAAVQRMNDTIAYRGPDDQGIWEHASGNLTLGHRRLSIIDLSPSGHQPMLLDNGDAIVFNGEIYNYNELRQIITGEQFKSTSDTEVLLHLLSKKGIDALQHANGMFAFAYWNESKQTLLLARDRAGKKPLYYTISNGAFVFSSELKAILTVPGFQKSLNEEQFYHFLTFNQVSAPDTLFQNVHKLSPGEWLQIDRHGKITTGEYWEIGYQDLRNRSEKELEELLLEGLEKAVGLRMIADVPVGAFLSGGVDSSAVVAMMSKRTTHPVKTFTIGFEGQPDFNELVYARTISKQFGTDHYEKIVQPQDLIRLIDNIADIFDDPIGDATAIPIYFISQLAREQGTIVVLSGDGSDELFAGYNSWKKYNQLYPAYNLYKRLPGFIKRTMTLFGGEDESPRADMLHRAAANQEFFWGGAKAFKESYKRKLLNPEWINHLGEINSYSVIEKLDRRFDQYKEKHPYLNHLDRMCYLGFRQQIPTRYLHRMDKLGMANSIEIRSPFLDYEFINLALSIPPEWKIRNNTPKYILKKSLEGILDHDTLYRKKMGFCVPLKEWAGTLMSEYVESHLTEFTQQHNYFNRKELSQHLSQINTGKSDLSNDLWTIYFLMAWFKKWM